MASHSMRVSVSLAYRSIVEIEDPGPELVSTARNR
jgi:hypothetical protein